MVAPKHRNVAHRLEVVNSPMEMKKAGGGGILEGSGGVGGGGGGGGLGVIEPLGGFIFVCNNDTMAEDLDRQLFGVSGQTGGLLSSHEALEGLPQRYQDSVEAIQPGLPLFLYNYSTRCLHGVFEASSDGGLNIEPEAWDTKETRKAGRLVSRFPAQVRVRWREERPPLEEEQFRPFLFHYDGPKFRLELSVKEANDMLKLFGTSSIQKTEKWQDDMGGEWERVKSKSKVTRVYRPPTKRSNSPNPPAGRRRAGSSNGPTNNNNGNASQSGVPTTTGDFGRGRESRADIAQKWRSDPDFSVASSSSSADVSTSSCVTHDDDNRSKKGVKKNGVIQVEANGIISVPNELPELQDASVVVVDLKGSEHHTNVSCEDSSERDSRADSDELHTELNGVRSNSQAGESQAGSQSPSRPGFASYSAALKAGMVGMFTDLSIGGDGLNFGGGVEIGDNSVNVVPSSINGAGSKAVVESGGNRRLVCNEGSGAPKLHNVVGGSEGTPTTACGNGDGKKVDNRKLGSDKEVTGLGATSTAAGAVERVLQNEGECVGRMSEGSNSFGTSAAAVEYAGVSVQKLSKNVSRPIEGERVVDRASSNYRARSSGGKLSADSTEYTATEIAQKSHSWQGVDAAAAVLSHPQVFSWGPNIRIMSSTVLPLDHCPGPVNSSSEGGLQKSSVSDSTMSGGKNPRQTSSPGVDGHQTLWQAGEQFETASPAVVYPSFPAQHLKASAHFQVPLSKTNRSVHDRRRGQQYDLPKERDELTQLARTSSLDQVPPQSLMPLRLPTPPLQPQQNFHYSTLSPAPPTAQYHDRGVRSDVGPHGMAYHYVTRSPVEGDLVMQNGVVQGICGVPPSPTTITLQSTPPLAGDGLFPLVPAQLLANAEELHMEILEFAQTASLSPEARIYAEAAVECVRNAVKILWPCADVEVFGSYATGLSLAHSDVDVVVVDAPPPPGTADAVPLYGSRALAPLIRLLGSSLQVYPWCVDINTIESATMPVIKLQCKPTVNGASAPQASVVKIDITIGGKRVKNVEATGGVQGNGVTGSNNNNNNNQVVGMPNVNKSASILHNGTATREYVIEKLHQQPALAPLVLLLKSYLQAKGLKDVYTGGLGSFSLTIMVVFYLERTSILYGMPGGVRPQVSYTGSGDAPNSSSADQLSPDGVVVVPSVTPGGTFDAQIEDPTSSATSTTAATPSNRTSTFSSPIKESLANGGIVEQLQKSMHTVSSPNLGILLIDFLHIFGVEIDFTKVRLVTKGNGGSGGLFYHDKQLRSAALTIDDPLRPGNNIGAGSFKMHDVQTALKSMLQILTSPPVASSQRVGMGPGKRRPLPLIDQLFTTSNTFLAPQ